MPDGWQLELAARNQCPLPALSPSPPPLPPAMESQGDAPCKKDAKKVKVRKLYTLKKLTMEECKEACQADDDCYAASFKAKNGRCKLEACGGDACVLLPMKVKKNNQWECFAKV